MLAEIENTSYSPETKEEKEANVLLANKFINDCISEHSTLCLNTRTLLLTNIKGHRKKIIRQLSVAEFIIGLPLNADEILGMPPEEGAPPIRRVHLCFRDACLVELRRLNAL